MAIGQLLMAGPARRKKKPAWSAETMSARALEPTEQEKLGAMTQARGRSAQERGIPMGYEPGAVAATERPDSYFVRDPTARAQLEAKERVAGRDLMTSGPGRNAMGDPFGLSRGTGLGPVLTGAPQLRKGATYQVSPLGGAASFPRDTKVFPGVAATETPSGAAARPEGGTVRLSGSYLSPAEAVMQAQKGGAAQREAWGQYSPAAQAALRAQRGPREGRRAIEDIATEQAGGRLMRAQAQAGAGVAPRAAEAGVAGMEAQARGMGAGATMLEAQALPAQQMLELWQTPEGKQQVMAMWETGSQQEKQAYAAQVLAEVGANLPPEIQQALAEAASGMRVEEYDGSWWQTGGVLGSVWDFLAGLVRGGPTMRRAVPATGAGLITGPTAAPGLPATGPNAPGAPPTGQFGFRGGIGQPAVQAGGRQASSQGGAAAGAEAGAVIPGNVDPATAPPEVLVAIRDAADAELQRRQRMGAR